MATGVRRAQALLAVLGVLLLWDCRGKEGPQGPPGPQGPKGPQGPAGQDLTRTQEGYLRGTVKGRDTVLNQNFQLTFDYTYIPTSSGLPGYWEVDRYYPDTLNILFEREGEKGGYCWVRLSYRRSTGSAWVATVYGDILNFSASQVQRYQVNYYLGWGSDTAYVAGLNFSGDTLISGKLFYIRRSKSVPDTLAAEFRSRVLRLIPYQRQGRNASHPLINLSNQ